MRFSSWLPALLLPSWVLAQTPAATRFREAADYSRAHAGDAVLVLHADQIVFEEYHNGYRADTPHMLASGTKSFSCAIAVAAIQDGLLSSFDEPVALTITEWRADSLKSKITIRHLLNLSSGLPAGPSGFEGIRRQRNADAIGLTLVSKPGETFRYGSSHYHVFGEVMRGKLKGEATGAYLQRRVLDRIGLTGLRIIPDREGQSHLPGGGFATAREWAKFGQLMRDRGKWKGNEVLRPALLEQCFAPSPANADYGLTFWLSTNARNDLIADAMRARGRGRGQIVGNPVPVIMAAGAQNQRLYILRDLDLVVLRFGRQDLTYDDAHFLTLIRRN
ncbi:MAG: serine hydrolase domain-containing protein [Gemmatimonadota bacterium]